MAHRFEYPLSVLGLVYTFTFSGILTGLAIRVKTTVIRLLTFASFMIISV